jgi:hypothetical protein
MIRLTSPVGCPRRRDHACRLTVVLSSRRTVTPLYFLTVLASSVTRALYSCSRQSRNIYSSCKGARLLRTFLFGNCEPCMKRDELLAMGQTVYVCTCGRQCFVGRANVHLYDGKVNRIRDVPGPWPASSFVSYQMRITRNRNQRTKRRTMEAGPWGREEREGIFSVTTYIVRSTVIICGQRLP